MKLGLRAKVVLMLLTVVIPVSIGFSLYRFNAERRFHSERMADRFATRLSERRLQRCERHPRRFAPRRRGFIALPYSADLHPSNPKAPPFPTKLSAKLEHAEIDEPVHERYWFRSGILGATAVKTSSTRGPCAVILIAWPDRTPRRGPPVFGRVAIQTFVLAFGLTLVGLLISAPLVRRVRRLTEAVRGASEGPFDNPEISKQDELAELAATFEESLEALHERDATLKAYIANTTHDLAIPLTVLQHRLKKLGERIDDDVSIDHLQTALEESHYIAGLIANMSAAAKLEADEIDATADEVDLGELVVRVVSRHDPIARQKNVELNFGIPEDPLLVAADPVLLEQAVSNLVQNAVQYNSSGGHVSVVLEREESGFDLTVSDDGPGIPENIRELVLERGVRGDDVRNRNEGGQGFGLAIAREVTERHGWEISISAREPSGTIVHITTGQGG